MNVLLRCDANEKIGMGHAIRCLALAQQLKKAHHTVTFVYRNISKKILRDWQKEGCQTFFIQCHEGWEEDSELTISLAKENNIDWIIVDGYSFHANYQKTIKKTGFKLLYIDDIIRQEYCVDILLNQNPGFQKSDYRALKNARLLLGPTFVLLREEFLKAAPNNGFKKDGAMKILLTMGGSDPSNFTKVILHSLVNCFRDSKIVVLIGSVNPSKDQFLDMEKDYQGHHKQVDILVDAENIAGLMSGVDLAVHAAGSTSWELAYLGVPGLCYTMADNQLATAKALEKRGCSINMGWVKDFAEEKLVKELKNLIGARGKLSKMSEAGKSFIDGHGAKRVVRELENATV